MKKITLSLFVFTLILIVGCSPDSENIENTGMNPNFRVFESSPKDGNSTTTGDKALIGDECFSVNLIAGQHHIAGTVTVSSDGANLILTYMTNEDWTIDLTHMSIGDCEEQWVPTTGSGNPKIGHFEHTEPHSAGTNEVVYMINLEVIPEAYCFAVHAEVQGPTGGETAWGEGTGFDGNSWAMYVEALLSDCNPNEEEEEGGGGSDEE
ncbi:MAG: hypothetical protein KJO41_02220 [Bacteroidia bacterium]|nr:hypothetical protein [Bacteroidia bacterium]NNL31780.1 hypothetical protein [Flavobacteriaceae bacterium]